MTKISELGLLHLRNVFTADQALRIAKASIKAQAKDWAAEKLRGYQAAVDHEVRMADNQGVPRQQILHAGLSTTAWETLYKSLERTEASAAALAGVLEAEPVSGPQFERNSNGTITLTLLGDVFEKSAAEHQWRSDDSALDGLHVWELDSEGLSLSKESDFMPEFAKRHPVGAWHTRNMRIARDWAAAN